MCKAMSAILPLLSLLCCCIVYSSAIPMYHETGMHDNTGLHTDLNAEQHHDFTAQEVQPHQGYMYDHANSGASSNTASSSSPSKVEKTRRTRRPPISREPTWEEIQNVQTWPILDLMRVKPDSKDIAATDKWNALFEYHPAIAQLDTVNLDAEQFEIAFRAVRGDLTGTAMDSKLQKRLTCAMRRHLTKVKQVDTLYLETFLSNWAKYQKSLMRAFKGGKNSENEVEHLEEHDRGPKFITPQQRQRNIEVARQQGMQSEIEAVLRRLLDAKLNLLCQDPIAMEESMRPVLDREKNHEVNKGAIQQFLQLTHGLPFANQVVMLRQSNRRRARNRALQNNLRNKKGSTAAEGQSGMGNPNTDMESSQEYPVLKAFYPDYLCTEEMRNSQYQMDHLASQHQHAATHSSSQSDAADWGAEARWAPFHQ
jgi:hypothetical protein